MSSTNQTAVSNSSQYGYQPSLVVGIIGLTIFTLSSIVHTYQMYTFRMWWLVVLILNGITEISGYSARIYSWTDDTNLDAFLCQTVTLILAPTFLSAALYVIFGQVISIIGRQYSLLPPMWYTILFVIADLISLIIQSVGGAQAASAARTHTDPSNGTHIMIAGICWQMLSMSIYVFLVILYIVRISKARIELNRDMKIFLFGMGIVTLMIFIRCIYRTIELQAGWTGYIITHEVYFACLDGLPMVIAFIAFNIFHPGRYLKKMNTINVGNTDNVSEANSNSFTIHQPKVNGVSAIKT